MRIAAAASKPLVHEKLDFSRRKKEPQFGWRPSVRPNAFELGVQQPDAGDAEQRTARRRQNCGSKPRLHLGGRPREVCQANRNFTSSSCRPGVARRGMGYGETEPCRSAIPGGRGDHIEFKLAARNRKKHEWSNWGTVRSKLQGTLAVWHRLRKLAALEVAARAAASSGQAGVGAVRPLPPNRQQHR